MATTFFLIDETVVAVAVRSTAALRVAGWIPARNKYLYGLQVVVLGLAVCVCDFLFLKAPPIQELYPTFFNIFFKTELYSTQFSFLERKPVSHQWTYYRLIMMMIMTGFKTLARQIVGFFYHEFPRCLL